MAIGNLELEGANLDTDILFESPEEAARADDDADDRDGRQTK